MIAWRPLLPYDRRTDNFRPAEINRFRKQAQQLYAARFGAAYVLPRLQG